MAGPGFHQNLHQRQTQQLILGPQMRQSLKILQAAALDLRATIQEELQGNPTLEEMPMDGLSLEKSAADNANADAAGEGDTGDSMDFDSARSLEILGKLNDDWRDHLSDTGGVRATSTEEDERRLHFLESITTEASLSEHLMRQAELIDATPDIRAAMRYLVGSLDDHGFLSTSLSDLALQSGYSLESVQAAAKLLRTFDPPGIGASNLPDCLLLQLAHKGRERSVAGRLIRDHFKLLVRRRIPDLARRMGLPPETIQEAISEIGALDPAPGRRFAEDVNRAVTPDVTIEREGDEWKITLNQDYIPRLRLSNTYRELIAKGKLSQAEQDYLREKLRSGKFIINAIEQRQRTIERIAREILNHQREFFEEGVSKLKPLTMTHIADLIKVHETTVSRAVANKYLKTPHGVFEFKFFFTSGYQSEAGESVANTSVKEMIADLISAEDPGKPHSDQHIVSLLEQKGLTVARRTVAKYRESLGLLPSNLRRRYD